MDLTARYENLDGEKVTILQAVGSCHEWAANRIQVGERALAMLTDEQRRAAELSEPAPSAAPNSRYATALEVVKEWHNETMQSHVASFYVWVGGRLNAAESQPHSA